MTNPVFYFALGLIAGALFTVGYLFETCHVWRMTKEERQYHADKRWEEELRCGGMR